MKYLLLLVLLSSCAHGDELASALSQPLDSTVRRQLGNQLQARRIKFNGPVTLQIGGTGNTGTATDATKAKAPVAAAPHAVATDNRPAGPSWKGYVLLVGLALGAGVAGGFYLARRLPGWLPI